MASVPAPVPPGMKLKWMAADIGAVFGKAAYVNAVLSRLDGLVYRGVHGKIDIKATIVDDRGPKSAESIYGADFAVTAVISTHGGAVVEKAILGQAKKGRVEELNSSETERLNSQVEKMRHFTDQYVVLEVPENGEIPPRIRLPRGGNTYCHPLTLENYITNKLVECLHGDRRNDFVAAVQDSRLSKLAILIRT